MKHQYGLTGYNHLARQLGWSSTVLHGSAQFYQIRSIHNTRVNAVSQAVPLQSTLSSHADHGGQNALSERFANALPFSSFLTDKHARQHTYLRISLTERCNLRCTYCMPEAGVPLSPQNMQLTTPEILLLSSLFVSQGVNKIRLTGGEPTVRKDIVPLMQQLGELRANGLKELCITSNGVALKNKLESMHKAGLTGVNLSLDTLDPNLFMIMARRPGFSKVIEAMERILAMNKMGAGIALKVNVVVMKGVNEPEILRFVELGKDKDLEVRFIEYMPFDGNKWARNKMVSYQDMLNIIRQRYPELEKVGDKKGDTSKSYRVPGFAGRVGFITSMTENFCATCNRLRITSDGNLKVCLFGNSEVSLRDLMRKGNDGQPIDEEALAAIKTPRDISGGSVWQESEHELLHAIGLAVGRKKAQHDSMDILKETKNRPMILIDKYASTLRGRHLRRQNVIGPMGSPMLDIPEIWTPFQASFQRLFSSKTKLRSIDQNSELSDKLSSELSVIPDGENASSSMPGERNSIVESSSLAEYISNSTTQQNDVVEDALSATYQIASQIEEELRLLRDQVKILLSQRDNASASPSSQKKSSSIHNSSNQDFVSLQPQPSPNNVHSWQTISRTPPVTLTHLDDQSAVHMVSVSDKPVTKRKAIAIGCIGLPFKVLDAIVSHTIKKGDVLGVARVAAIQAVKKTSDIIPLCHPGLAIEGVKVDISLVGHEFHKHTEGNNMDHLPPWLSHWLRTRWSREPENSIKIAVTVESMGKTGIEMEALTGVTGGLLTIYDMCKSMTKVSIISSRVAFKSGGRSGTWNCGLASVYEKYLQAQTEGSTSRL